MSEKSFFNNLSETNKAPIKKINVASVDAHDVHVLDAEYDEVNNYEVPLDELGENLQDNIDNQSIKQEIRLSFDKSESISNREHDRRRKRNDDKTKKPQR